MTNNSKANYPMSPVEQARLEAGSEGKLRTVELQYRSDSEIHLLRKRNLFEWEVKNLRESVFRFGYGVPVAKGHFRIIPPFDIIGFDIFEQKGFFQG